MTDNTQTANVSPAVGPVVPAPSVPSARRWLLGAMLLAGAAQLMTISALVSADPVAATWATLLLAIAPVLVTAAAVLTPAPANRLLAAAGVVILVVGIAGHIAHVGALFFPALLVLAVGTARLWRG
jgi:hypothetical protein